MVDVKKFIGEMRERSVLWDVRCPTNDLKERNNKWREVSEMFNISVLAAKQKWKNLRDTFRAEVKKQIKRATEDLPEGAKRKSTWKHFEDMSFLKDILEIGPSDVTREEPNTPHDNNTGEEEGYASFLRGASSSTETSTSTDEINEQDDDRMFLLSLLPFVKKLPDNKKLYFRTRVQQLLQTQLYS